MAILVNAQSKILLQVLTALDDPRSPLHLPYFASNTVGWVGVSGATPANRGHWLLDSLPAYASLAEAVAETGADVSVVMADADLVADLRRPPRKIGSGSRNACRTAIRSCWDPTIRR